MPLLINFSNKYGIWAYTCFHNVIPIVNAVWLSVVITLKFLTLIQISQKIICLFQCHEEKSWVY